MDAAGAGSGLSMVLVGSCGDGVLARVCVDPVIVSLVQGALVLLFATAAFHKLADLSAFEAVFGDYEILPRAWAPLGAHALVSLELAVTVALAWGLLPLAGASTASLFGASGVAGAMTVYALAIGVNLARGRRDLDCGCMGPAGRPQRVAAWLIARNAVVAAAAAGLAAVQLGVLGEGVRPLHWIDGLTLAGGLGVVALVWTALHGLAAASPGMGGLEGGRA
jgi:hypothetical protein